MIEKWKIVSIHLIALLLVFGCVMFATAGEPPLKDTCFEKGKIAAVLVIAVDNEGTTVPPPEDPLMDPAADDDWYVTISGVCTKTTYLKGLPDNPLIPVSWSMPPLIDNPVGGELVDLPAYVLYQQLPGAGPPGCWSAEGGENLRISNVKPFIYLNDRLAAAKVTIRIEIPCPPE